MANEKIKTVVGYSDTSSLEDFINLTSSQGDPNKALGNTLYGINHRQIDADLSTDRIRRGHIFFTRPQLNLTTSNIENFRSLYPLLSENETSISRFVRNTLDPRLHHKLVKTKTGNIGEVLQSPLVDPKNVFMPVLTNIATSCTGWPDLVLPTYTTPNGVRKEQYSMVDGVAELFETFDLDVGFKNFKGEPILQIMATWLLYMGATFEGIMSPYLDFIVERELDYNTRIYEIAMDETGKYVKKIAATGASFPLNVPYGKFFDWTKDKTFQEGVKDFSIRFRCMGAIYNEDILVKEFNDSVGIFHPGMRNLNKTLMKPGGVYTDNEVLKIPSNILEIFNYRGYPRIDPKTYELEWWIDSDSKRLSNLLKRSGE